MLKKVISLILVALIVFSSVGTVCASAAKDDTMDILVNTVKKFPHGKYWNHMGSKKNDPDSVTDTPCKSHNSCHWQENSCNCNSFDNAIQCMGYAYRIAYEIVGESPRDTFVKTTKLDTSKLCVGDVIRYRKNQHSLCVTGVSGSKISFTDCNWTGKCQIRWGVIDVSEIKKLGFNYVLHHPDNNRKNTDLDFYKDVEISQERPVAEKYEIWEMNDEGNLNVREKYTVSAELIGKINKGSQFKVYARYFDGEYLWGKVKCAGGTGWSVLNYAEYVKGTIESPNITNLSTYYNPEEKFTLNWSKVSGAESYTVYLYDKNKKLIKKYTAKSAKQSLKINESGKYFVKVCAYNGTAPSWKAMGKPVSFTVKEHIKAESLKINKTYLTIAKGNTYTLAATIKPSDATNKSVVWKSSDTSVVSVDSKGKIVAKNFGTATITCTSKENSKLSVKCTVKVLPAKVRNIKQSGSASGTATVKWDKVGTAESYKVYMYNEKTKKYEYVGNTKTNSYKLSLKSGATAKIKVYSIGKKGSTTYKSVSSDVYSVLAGPAKPTMKASAGSKQIKLSWNKVSGATNYVLYQYVDGELQKIATLDSKTLSYTVKKLKTGKSYSFKIRAVKKTSTLTGYGSYSSKVTAKVK